MRGTKGVPFECGGGDQLGSERTKAGRRETPRKRSERIEVILSKRDMSCFCWVLTKSLQRNTETQKCATEPLRICLRRCTTTLEKQLLHTRRGCPPPNSPPCVCVSGSPFRGLLRRRRSTFLPPGLPTPPPDPNDPSEGTCDLVLHHHGNKIRIY